MRISHYQITCNAHNVHPETVLLTPKLENFMSDHALDMRSRIGTFATWNATTYDVVIIGGGITGAGIARDAAERGLSVALVEAQDFATGTSSRSSKMIHGGLRYLPQGDIPLVKEAASERQILRRIAPHLARKTQFVLPATSAAGIAKLRAGMWAFEKLGKVPAEDKHQVLNKKEFTQQEPAANTDPFSGAVLYPEFLTNDARLTIANIRAAKAAGADVLNYASVTSFKMENGRATAARVSSTHDGETLEAEVRAKLFINAAGPWVDAVRALEDETQAPKLTLTKGIHIVVPHAVAPVKGTLIIQAPDKRSVFAVPRHGFTYFGTTDTFYDKTQYWPHVEKDDIDYLLQSANKALGVDPITHNDITSLWSGTRPLISQPGKKPSDISRKDEIWTGPGGVLIIAGGKLSAYRKMAERIVDQCIQTLGLTAKPCVTDTTPLPGGESTHSIEEITAKLSANMPPAQALRLAELYGSEAEKIATAPNPLQAEAEHAVTHEGALTLEDVWVRRTARAWFAPGAGLPDLAQLASAMRPLLGWSPEEQAKQILQCEQRHADVMRNVSPTISSTS